MSKISSCLAPGAGVCARSGCALPLGRRLLAAFWQRFRLGWLFWLCGVLLPAASAWAQLQGDDARTAPLTLGASARSVVDVSHHTEWLEDPDGRLTLDDVRGADALGRFRPTDGVLSRGYHPATVWLRLALRRGPDAPVLWWLSVPRGYLDSVRLWLVGPDGRVDVERLAGDRVRPEGALPLETPAFELGIDEPGVHVVYLRVKTRSAVLVPVALQPREQALGRIGVRYLSMGAVGGASLLLVLAALLGYAGTRERLYLVFSGFVLADAVLWLAVAGVLHQVVFAQSPPWSDRLIALLTPVASALGALLQLMLIDVRRRAPALWPWVLGLVGYFLSLVLVQLALPERTLTPWSLHGLLAGLGLLVVACLHIWPQAGRVRRGIMVCLILASTLSAYNAVSVLGWVPATWLMDAGYAGSHLLLVAVGVFYLVNRAIEANRRQQRAEALAADAVRQHQVEQTLREEKSELLSMIAHEVRTPLTVIDTAMQSLAVLDQPMPPERLRRHERIGRALARLVSLIDLVVSRDRLDVSEWSQTLEPVEPQPATQAVLDDLSDEQRERVRLECAQGLPVVTADARMLRHALLNLVDNALKYSPAGQPVEVFVQRVRMRDSDGVAWTVLDHGTGIHVDDRERVFRKYYRAGDRSDAPGLGLGLYLVRQIAERHTGQVRVVPTAAGSGACLEFWIPLTPGTAKITPAGGTDRLDEQGSDAA